jgi:D-glycero-D-manno-heptose 1,7-bisphosphate phosphatase
MVFEAQREHDLDLARSFFIGDKAIDVECGRNAGVRTILVRTGYGAQETHAGPDWIAENFAAAADLILNSNKSSRGEFPCG